MFHSILVPVDMAQVDVGAAAIALARDVAKVRGGTVILLNVVEQLPGYIAAQLPVEVIRDAANQARETMRKLAADAGLPAETDVVVRDGHPGREILDYAGEIGADLIVIASHDPGISDLFLGSVAGHVVRHAHCSVLVARKLTD